MVAQAAADGSVYIDSTAGSERMQQLFASGKMAMNVAGPYTLPEYVDAKVDYGVVSMPSFDDEHTTIAGPDTWAIFDNGDERVGARRSSSSTGSASPSSSCAGSPRPAACR